MKNELVEKMVQFLALLLLQFKRGSFTIILVFVAIISIRLFFNNSHSFIIFRI